MTWGPDLWRETDLRAATRPQVLPGAVGCAMQLQGWIGPAGSGLGLIVPPAGAVQVVTVCPVRGESEDAHRYHMSILRVTGRHMTDINLFAGFLGAGLGFHGR